MALTQQQYKTLLDANQVAFEGQIENAYLESMGVTNQPALPGQSLDQVNDPGDKMEGQIPSPKTFTEANVAHTSENSSPNISRSGNIGELPHLTWYPSVLIYGAQGSGKTSLAEREVSDRLYSGHRAIVLDPHAAYGAWRGCEVVGAGMDYKAIDKALKEFADEVEQRYKIIANQPNPKFEPLTVVCDEFTNWASRCKNSAEFFKAALSDIRKAECYVLIVSHTRTLPALGDAKGMSSLRDVSLLEIEMLGEIDPETSKARPKFEALVKLPGKSDRLCVKIPKFDLHSPQSPPPMPPKNNQPGDDFRSQIQNYLADCWDAAPPDCPADRPNLSAGSPDCPTDSGQPEPLPKAVSGFTWSVRKVREFYPDTTPEQLFLSVSASAKTPNVTARDIIKSILKCREGNDHPTRSYTRHGKTLLRWLIENYDDGAIASLPEIKKFLEAQP